MKDFELMILGKPYKVEFKNDCDIQGNMGTANRQYQRIMISAASGKEQIADTLLHEAIHIIDKELALGFSEETVQRLACGLHSAGCFIPVPVSTKTLADYLDKSEVQE